ncbi:MAG: GGDEF domain-containing protein [Acidimicrobiales bacterium]|nr:GGDEF domain-containing protein [Hyphomonadaceae bacterium]RZV42275.1 MAG: GGDEF domain-containing protein [Acidimicrobiales bacterium]
MNSPGLSKQIYASVRTPSAENSSEFTADDRRALLDEISLLRTRILNLEHAADTDPLVPIYNRRAFMREISRAQTVMSRYDIPSSIIFFDLNGFKAINDRYGHSIGDDFLKKVGIILKASVRECDMVARIGGDEFGVLLFKTDGKLADMKAAALACRIAEQKIEMPTGAIHIRCSWGVSDCNPEETVREILERADQAMYADKFQN